MRDEDTADLVLALLEVLSICENIVDSWGILVLELESAVDHHDIIPVFNSCDIATDLFYSAEDKYADVTFGKWRDHHFFLFSFTAVVLHFFATKAGVFKVLS